MLSDVPLLLDLDHENSEMGDSDVLYFFHVLFLNIEANV